MVWNYIILVLGVDGLVVRRDVDLIVGEFVLAEVLEEVCVSRPVEVNVCVIGVFRLGVLAGEFPVDRGVLVP